MILRSMLTNTQSPWVRFNGDPFIVVERASNRSPGDSCTTAKAGPISVRLDVNEDDAAYHVTADLPGLTENEIEVTFEDGVLCLHGEKKIAREEVKGTWHITERSHGSFERRISLPNGVDADKIEARFNKGVLNLTLPKLAPEAPKARKIQVKGVN